MNYSYLFLFLLLFILFLYKPKEKYTNYKKIIVKPNKRVFYPLIFISDNSNINKFIFKIISKYIPSIKLKITNNSKDLLKTINLNTNLIGVISEFQLLNYIDNNPTNNISFICNLFSKQLTLISISEKSIADLKGKTIATMKYSSAYYAIKRLQNLFKFKIVLLDKIKVKNIYKILSKKKIDVVAVFIANPNKELEELSKLHQISIFGLGRLPEPILKTVIANYKKGKIDISYYQKEKNYMIPTIEIYNVIITNKNTDDKIAYSIINDLYHNFSDIRLVKNTYLKRQTNYFNVSNIFNSDNKKFKLNNGIYKYYRNKGYISNIDRNICRKYIGIQECDLNVRLNPYRLL